MSNFDKFGLEVTRTCRPTHTAKKWGLSGPVHCAVIVWHWEEDECGNMEKVVDAQYSLEYGNNRFDQADPNSETYKWDRDAFHEGTGNVDIPMPPIYKDQNSFDEAVKQNGNTYGQGPYNAYTGPNSNTAADNLIRNSGGNPDQNGGWKGF